MPSKRRNNGRSKKNRGHVKPVICINCGRLVAKDKAIKRFSVRDMIDASSKKDIRDAIPFENASIIHNPHLYINTYTNTFIFIQQTNNNIYFILLVFVIPKLYVKL